MLSGTLLSGCGATPAPTNPPPRTCPVIPDDLLTCPPGASKPAPIDMVTLTIALTEERTAGEVCRARMDEVRGLVGE